MLLVAAALASACAGGSDVDSESASVAITTPADGAVVSSPVTVRMSAVGFRIEPAGAARAGAGHFHIMVDAGCVPAGEPIPFEPGYNHYGGGESEATLELSPGEYVLCLQAGNGEHTATDLTDRIEITVAG